MTDFTIFPAIDLRRGRVVRLAQGDPTRETEYDTQALAVASRWREAGATWLHMVNLDGAMGEDDAENRAAMRRLVNLAGVQVQVGGGVRTVAGVEAWLELGAARVVLGTAAAETPHVVERAVREYGSSTVAVGIDAREGFVRVRGWRERVAVEPVEMARRMADLGVQTVIFTNILRDGVGTGVDIAASEGIAAAADVDVIASGGVATLDDVRAVKAAGLAGVIVGRALYEGAFSLKEALAC
ncbi:MAG: 1-(5-phosphoribosyl)-5-[(5-phosphoribosylamino)methylideneamino]imidazole-4-carboxamide isomerase [Candidatus Promineifilaceae bacterium]|nr:1-(5-phosphoribosyl)-5-[(5-phosphoribosylamino)methylideneamino]imidazole-4-carboxamide isomerase [Candidatus Promineifilaceae bacterium]